MVTPSLSGVTELYILERKRLPAILVPDSSGIPTLIDPQPVLLRGAYISPYDLEIQLPIAKGHLNSGHNHNLLAFLPCPDGAPFRSCICLAFLGVVSGASWRDEHTSRHGAQLQQWGVTTPQGQWTWITDVRNGRPGFFLTGDSTDASLWRIFRLETDALNRAVLTLAPIRLTASLPVADFAGVGGPLRSDELAAQYADLCRSVGQHAYRDVVTKARNIVEALVAARLQAHGLPAAGQLYKDLQTVREQLDAHKSTDECGFGHLDYHLAHKIRLLHAQTHVGQTVVSGRPLRPELAMSVAEDLAELLRAWGFSAP